MIEITIRNRLVQAPALAGGRVTVGIAPDGTVRPYITLQHIGGTAGMVFCGPDGSDSGSVQIDCWATTALAATQLGWQVFHRLTAQDSEFAASSIRRLPSDYEPDTKLHRVSWEVAATTETPTP